MSNWKDRIEAAEARKSAAALCESDAAEIEGRALAAKAEAEADDAERVKRDLDLARRLDAARAAKPGDTFRALAIVGWPDTFIVRRDGAAFAAWQASSAEAQAAPPAKRFELSAAARLQYAQASVYDWNGRTLATSQDTVDLLAYLKAAPGVVIPITDAALEMAGVVAEAAKS